MHGERFTVGFVVGPGRSGTTLLYKLLCLHPGVAYISNLEHRLPWLPAALTGRFRLRSYRAKLRHWFRAEGNAYLVRRPLATRLMPVPVEGEGVYRRCGMPLFPGPEYRPETAVADRLSGTFAGLAGAREARVLVSKRTANNRRLPALNAIFPGARYVYLIRDGRDVAASLGKVDWWNDHPLWWDELRRTPAQAAADGEDMLRLCARNWVAETAEIDRGLTAVAPARVLRVRYEDLVASPLAQMDRMLDFLGLERRADYDAALRSLRLSGRAGGWQTTWSTGEIAVVQREQKKYLRRLGYMP